MVSGVNSVNSYSIGVQNTKKKSPVKTGAAIGGGVGLTYTAVDLVRKRGVLTELLQDGTKQVGRNKALAIVAGFSALITAACTGMGASLGAIVKAAKGDKTAKEA